MKYNFYGFWKEYAPNPAFDSIRDAHLYGDLLKDKELIIKYLRGCSSVHGFRSMAFCELCKPEEVIIQPATFHSDGTWIWTRAVGHYVERFDLVLPEAFLAHIRAHYQTPVPVFSEKETEKLGRLAASHYTGSAGGISVGELVTGIREKFFGTKK